MFDMGFWEVSLIFVILLLVVGPERLPGLVRTVGLYVGKARAMVNSVKAEVERELQVDELKRSLQKNLPREEIERLGQDMRAIGRDLEKPAAGAAGPSPQRSTPATPPGGAERPRTADGSGTDVAAPSAPSAPVGDDSGNGRGG